MGVPGMNHSSKSSAKHLGANKESLKYKASLKS